MFEELCAQNLWENNKKKQYKNNKVPLETENLEYTPNVNISLYFDHVFLTRI